jgi:hypothetical protein
MNTLSPTPDAILQTAFGFWNSMVLLTAVTFDLFTKLGRRRLAPQRPVHRMYLRMGNAEIPLLKYP